MFQNSKSLKKYSAAVGLFRDEYASIDSKRSIASIDAFGMI
jgi:hypothetical protein